MSDFHTSLSTIIKPMLEVRDVMVGISIDDINKMMDELIPVVIEYLSITIDERKNPVCHDSCPISTAINIVIKCAVLDLNMLIFLKMKYAEISDVGLTPNQLMVADLIPNQLMVADLDSYMEAKDLPIKDKFAEIMEYVYRKNNYLLQDGPILTNYIKTYIEPIRKLFSGHTVKSSMKT